MRSVFLEYARLIRLPGLGGFSIAPVFGAISLIEIGVYVDLKFLILIFVLGVFKSIYGIVLNDYVDIEVDRLSEESDKRPLVKGTISKRNALLISILSLIVIFVIIFIFFYRSQTSFYLGVLCAILATIIGTIYDLYGKKFVGSDFLVAAAEGLFVLVGAFLVSPDGTLSVFTWVISILVFNQYLFMNAVIGGLKDADHDYLLNVKNIALSSGVKVYENNNIFIPLRFKIFALSIRFFSCFIVFIPFVFFGADYELWQILLLSLLVVLILYLSIKLVNIKNIERKGKIVKFIGLQGVLRYSLVPIMLIPVVGLFIVFILLIFPLIWFIIFRFTVVKDYFAT
jgi:4-hydroxybenzoate polyprenyltransferase